MTSKFAERKRVLVLDGDTRTCLVITRSLGKAGWLVGVAGSRTDAISFMSTYANEALLVPSPVNNPDAFAKMILERASGDDLAAIVPCTDASIAAIEPYLTELSKLAALPIAKKKVLRLLADRAEYLEEAAKIGIATPKQIAIQNFNELPSISFSFPVFLKPKRSMVRRQDTLVKIEVMKARNLDELSYLIRSIPPEALPGLVQSQLHGEVERYYAIYKKGKPVAEFGQKRIRWLNTQGNPSVLRQAAEPDPKVVELSRLYLSKIGMDGPVMVEFMRDLPGGKPVLLKVSPHFWKSLQTAVDAGLDMPCLAVDSALGKKIEKKTVVRYGIRSRWLVGDALHLLSYIFGGKKRFYSDDQQPSVTQAIANFLSENKSDSTYVEDKAFNDPKPYYIMRNRFIRQWLKKFRHNLLSRFRMGPYDYRGTILVEESTTDDRDICVEALRETLQKKGFRFAFTARPADGMTPDSVDKFVENCARECTDQFLVIPGFEYSFSNIHIIAMGMRTLLVAKNPVDLIRQIRDSGAMAVWSRIRPGAIPNNPDIIDEINGVLIWNINKHGPYGPPTILLDDYAVATERSPYLGAFMGMDPSAKGASRLASMRVYASQFNETGIISAMENGLFRLSGVFFSARCDRMNFILYRTWAHLVDVAVHWFRGVFDQIFQKDKKSVS